MRTFSSSKQTFVRLRNPVSVCSWVRVGHDFDCLVTGHEGGRVGFSWLPTPTSAETPHSSTSVYDHIKPITHIATTTQHNDIAITASNGNLLLLRISWPHVPIENIAALVSGGVETVLGVAWSHSGSSLATLRCINTGKTLSLRVYLELNGPGDQPTTVNIILPRTMTGEGVVEEARCRQQRVAWGGDKGEDIIISLANNTILLISTQSWQVISQVKFPYSPRISTVSDGTISALTDDKNLCLRRVSGQMTHFPQFSVDTYTWVSSIEMLIAAARDASKQMLLFISKEGEVVSSHQICTSYPVLDIAWREGRNSIVYSTEEGIFSQRFHLGVPSLKQLAGWAVEDTKKLPTRLRYEVLLSQASLFYPPDLMDTLELDVRAYCKPVSTNRKRKVVKVGKEYLGQELQLFQLKQPKFLHKKNLKLESFSNKQSDLLRKLVPESIVSLPADTRIIPGNKVGTYEVIRQKERLQINIRCNKITISQRGKTVDGEVKEGSDMSAILIEGEESALIIGSRQRFKLVMLQKSKLALLDLLLISSIYILYKY